MCQDAETSSFYTMDNTDATVRWLASWERTVTTALSSTLTSTVQVWKDLVTNASGNATTGSSTRNVIDAGARSSDSNLVVAGSVGAASLVSILFVLQYGTSMNPMGRCWRFWKQLNRQESSLTCADSVDQGVQAYAQLHASESSTEHRVGHYASLVNAYYDLATVFYEWGWGSSFHFSYEYPWESFAESMRRHEYLVAAHLGGGCYGPQKHVLDVGCGIGGPARTISTFLQCQITGLTLNPYQVQRGNELNAAAARHCTVSSVQGDFMALPFAPETFDGAYAIEATCHAPDRVACYQQVYRVLRPGATFCLYEWCLTDVYNAQNPDHVRLKKDIELGNGLPDIITTAQCLQAMRDAGFEIVTESDLAVAVLGSANMDTGTDTKHQKPYIQPWMTPLQPSWNILSQRFQFNPVGAVVTNIVIGLLEGVGLAPAGTKQTQEILQAGGFALRDAGAAGIFTTMYLLVGRKPP